MASVWEIFQEVASLTRHIQDLQTDVKQLRQDAKQFESAVNTRLGNIDVELATLRTALEGTRENSRETVRAELAIALADLRVRFAEEARRPRPELPEG